MGENLSWVNGGHGSVLPVILPPHLTVAAVSTGIEVYRYTDPSDGSWVEMAVDNAGLLSLWDFHGTPEMPYQVMQWICARAEYLAEGRTA